METFVTVIHVIVALFMILVVLIQGGNQGGVGAAFGGGSGSSSLMGATGSQSLLGKITYGAAAVFMMTSIYLTVVQSEGGSTGLKEQLREKIGDKPAAVETTPTDAASPAPANEAAPVENEAAPAENAGDATTTTPAPEGEGNK